MEISENSLDIILNDMKREQVRILNNNDNEDQEYNLKYGALLNSICVSINRIKKLRQAKNKSKN
jgi:hypothetical protein